MFFLKPPFFQVDFLRLIAVQYTTEIIHYILATKVIN